MDWDAFPIDGLDRRWLNPIFDDGCQFRLHSKPVCDGIRPARGVARLLRRRQWSAATMSSTERFHEGARDLYVIFLLFGHLCEVGLGQVAPYIHRMCLYLYSMMYVFLI